MRRYRSPFYSADPKAPPSKKTIPLAVWARICDLVEATPDSTPPEEVAERLEKMKEEWSEGGRPPDSVEIDQGFVVRRVVREAPVDVQKRRKR